MAVAAIAAGAVLFTGGAAQAADSSAIDNTVAVTEGGHYKSDDQGNANICGNVLAYKSIVVNFTDCDATNVDADFGHHR